MNWSLSSFEFQLICHMTRRKIVKKKVRKMMSHSSQYIFINKSVFTKRSTRNFGTIPESSLWYICYSSVCDVLLFTLRLFFEFSWSEKILLLKVLFFPLLVDVLKSIKPSRSVPQSAKILSHQYLIPSSSNHELPSHLTFWKTLLEDWPNTEHPFMCNVIPYWFVRLICLSPDAVALLFP